MKKSTAIMQMLYGQRGNANAIKDNAKVKERMDTVNACYEKMREALEDLPEIWKLFNEYIESTTLFHLDELDEHYEEGFQFGLLIGIEAGESKFAE